MRQLKKRKFEDPLWHGRNQHLLSRNTLHVEDIYETKSYILSMFVAYLFETVFKTSLLWKRYPIKLAKNTGELLYLPQELKYVNCNH